MKIHIPHPEIIPVIRIESDGNRYYKTPEGNLYPSVTSVTGYESRLAIQQWKDKIGHDKANEISAIAANRGTRIHSYAEDYLNNKQVIPDMFDKQNWDLFLPLLKNIDNIHGVELN